MKGPRIKFSLGLVAMFCLIAVVLGTVAGRASTDSDGGGGSAGPAAVGGKRVDVIIKASDSSFWQAMLAGAKKAGADFGLEVDLFGPTSVDNPVTTDTDGFIGTDNLKAGETGGRRLCDLLKKQGRTSGEIIIESAVAGVQVLQDRDAGFKKGLAETCPNVKVATTRYNNNNKASDKIPVVAFDSDPAENAALADGSIDALVVQNPYFFGYQGVLEAAMATVKGNYPPLNLDPGAVVVDCSNMEKPDIARLLKPPTEKL
jgi:ribose transport system substrate-binding protein